MKRWIFVGGIVRVVQIHTSIRPTTEQMKTKNINHNQKSNG